jgi:predicted MFS family arabinose efflux permease
MPHDMTTTPPSGLHVGGAGPPQVRGKSKSDFSTVIALTVSMGVFYVGIQLVGLLAEPIKHSLKFTDTQMGLITGASLGIAYALLIIPAARLADRWNRRHALILCGLVFCGSTLLAAVAHTFAVMLVAHFLVAACGTLQYSLCVALIAEALPENKRPLGYAIYTAGVWFALALGFWMIAYLERLIGWRGSFYAIAILYLLLLPAVWWLVGDSGRVARTSPPSVVLVLKMLIRKRTFLALVGIACLYGFAVNISANWVSAFLIRSHGYSQFQAANYLALSLGLSAGAVTLMTGRILLKARLRGPAGPLRISRDATFFILALYLLGLSTTATSAPTFLWLGLALSGFINGVIMTGIQELAEPLYRATAAALLLLPDCLLGNGGGPFVAGILSDALTSTFGSNALRVSLLISTCTAWVLTIPIYNVAMRWIGRDAVQTVP